jgi:hypothetical protein
MFQYDKLFSNNIMGPTIAVAELAAYQVLKP